MHYIAHLTKIQGCRGIPIPPDAREIPLNACQVLPRWWFSAKPCVIWYSRLGREGRDWQLSQTVSHNLGNSAHWTSWMCVYTQAAPIFGRFANPAKPPCYQSYWNSLSVHNCFVFFLILSLHVDCFMDWIGLFMSQIISWSTIASWIFYSICFPGETVSPFPLLPLISLLFTSPHVSRWRIRAYDALFGLVCR